MIRKLLIANRGEITCRIIRTCRQMGIATVAVFSDADAKALHVEMADEAVHIGPSPAHESYLNSQKLIEAAHRTGANAIHPGYGFLAENAEFAHSVVHAGLTFIGPTAHAINAMGDKRRAKQMLKDVPFVPGYTGDDQSNEAMIQAADEIGYPIMVKASAGGGGKGMREVHAPENLPDALDAARREAKQAFGDDTLMLERIVSQPRHVEIQLFGDANGTVIALGERECTVQRRHQKVVEEAPSTALTPNLREAMCATAVSIGQQLGYLGAGTVEFLVDERGNYYFMEMNTRLQVEHPVTEMVYGLDLVRWQIEVADGKPLPTDFDYSQINGHAVEVRVYAEDPGNDFLPSIGDVLLWRAPADVRVDAGLRSGDAISPYYDPMVAKIIAHGRDRDEAIRKLDRALSRTILFGLRNNIGFLRRVLTHPAHMAGQITTRFIPDHPELTAPIVASSPMVLSAAAIAKQRGTRHWRNNPNRPIVHRFQHGDETFTVKLTPAGRDRYRVHAQDDTLDEEHEVLLIAAEEHALTLRLDGHQQRITIASADGERYWVDTPDGTIWLDWLSPLPKPGQRAEATGSLHAPMPGQVIQVNVSPGDSVQQGAVLMIVEAMKMEHRIEAPYDGVVEQVHYQAGDSVPQDAVLLELHMNGSDST